MSLHCPKCGDPLSKDGQCGSCGYRREKATAVVAVDHLRCAWESNGERCRYVGTWSAGTRGEGPWYCRGHSWSDGELGQRIVEESRKFSVDSYTAAAVVSASRSAFLDRPIGQAKPLADGVRRPKGGGSFRRAADIVRAHFRQPGEEG